MDTYAEARVWKSQHNPSCSTIRDALGLPERLGTWLFGHYALTPMRGLFLLLGSHTCRHEEVDFVSTEGKKVTHLPAPAAVDHPSLGLSDGSVALDVHGAWFQEGCQTPNTRVPRV